MAYNDSDEFDLDVRFTRGERGLAAAVPVVLTAGTCRCVSDTYCVGTCMNCLTDTCADTCQTCNLTCDTCVGCLTETCTCPTRGGETCWQTCNTCITCFPVCL